jgi:leucyl-tRNA synthetase
MQYSPSAIDQAAKKIWSDKDIYKIENDISKPKHYVLEMFPYPSGAGLHVGHPLGYVASDIYARFKRMKGFNVLHPMGFDSFGLPAEQYAIETGKDPRDTTKENIATYKKQFDKIGLSFDWSREVVTSSPEYYKWTQWLFIEMFNSIYCYENQCAYSVDVLIKHFEEHGNHNNTAFTNNAVKAFSSEEWKNYTEKEKSDILMNYRLIYTSMGEVNWCEALGTVLANDEVINGRSERGNHPVVKKKMRQWSLRMTAYADRLLQGLEEVDFSNSLKDQQRNWIGKSQGATARFKIQNSVLNLEFYTTRPDTIFGATFMVMAPEHAMVSEIVTDEYKTKVTEYIAYCKSKSDIDRQAEKEVSGQFTGAYAIHPFHGKLLPIYIAEYVLMGYGTGAIMAVPAEDERDRKFAEKFGIEIVEIFDKTGLEKTEVGDKQGVLKNSDFIDGLHWKEGFDKIIERMEYDEIGERKTQFRLRDANFSRQRYWGEPIPILWKDEIPIPLDPSQLPLLNPDVDSFLPSKDGQAPNARNEKWVNEIEGYTREVDTMPAFAGSSWYFLRYMDPQNDTEFVSKDLVNYWGQVDLYQGGSEHAVGHLLYSRYFNHFLYDRGYISHKEPFKRLINQGMIQGRTQFVYRSNSNENLFISKGLIKNEADVTPIRVDVNIVENDVLNIEGFKQWRAEYVNAQFELENGNYICGWEIEKMSKSKYNVVNPDDVIAKYGADCFRMYEMFLGPIEQSKPWNTAGIEGVSKFLKRFWNLYFDENGNSKLTPTEASVDELKILNRTVDKLAKDIENFSFNTCVSAFMIAMNELNALKTTSDAILIQLLKSICPFAPHTAETIWSQLGHTDSIIVEEFPEVDEKYLVDDTIEYPVSINGKMRAKVSLAADADETTAKESALSNETVLKWLEGKEIKKFIFVHGRMINIVV